MENRQKIIMQVINELEEEMGQRYNRRKHS